jgi:ketosteroid isomerase-like protein
MSEQNVEVVREVYTHLERGQYFVRHLVAEDLVFVRRGAALGLLEGEWRGFEDIQAAVFEYIRSWDDLRNELQEIRDVDERRVLALDRQIGRGRASGVVMEREMATLFTLREGKIIRWESYWERTDALDAAGLSS